MFSKNVYQRIKWVHFLNKQSMPSLHYRMVPADIHGLTFDRAHTMHVTYKYKANVGHTLHRVPYRTMPWQHRPARIAVWGAGWQIQIDRRRRGKRDIHPHDIMMIIWSQYEYNETWLLSQNVAKRNLYVMVDVIRRNIFAMALKYARRQTFFKGWFSCTAFVC